MIVLQFVAFFTHSFTFDLQVAGFSCNFIILAAFSVNSLYIFDGLSSPSVSSRAKIMQTRYKVLASNALRTPLIQSLVAFKAKFVPKLGVFQCILSGR